MTTQQPNPLIPNHADEPAQAVPSSHDPVLKPATPPAAADNSESNPAADLIRQKLAAIYSEEPDTKAEIAEVEAITEHRSKHQQFMHQLSSSGRALAEIQAAWHQYYAGLPDAEKREVWQEFYDNSAKARRQAQASQTALPAVDTGPQTSQPITPVQRINNPLFGGASPQPSSTAPLSQSTSTSNGLVGANLTTGSAAQQPLTGISGSSQAQPQTFAAYTDPASDPRPAGIIRDQIRDKVSARSTLKVKHHLQSLLFGLGFGGLVIVIVLFSFFNEVIIAPFIQPSRSVSATPIIVGSDGVAASDKDEVIIPKINLEIPLDFSAKTIDENEIENGLENGVVHYPTTALPGQQGNTSFFGHSSNNIFNPGKYKFAFVLLHELVPGDTFILNYKGVAYTYQVYDKKVVEPTDVSVLNPVAGKASTAVLITCDPPGTSLHRLVVWGEQVSPNPSSNSVATPTPTTSGAKQTLPGNGPTLWRRLVNAITGS